MGTKDIALFALCLMLCFGTAGIGGYFNSFGLGQWYDSLKKPSFNPPAWVFGPVWTVLYLMMAISLWRVWRRWGEIDVRWAVGLFLVHLVLNAAWSGIFFALHKPDINSAVQVESARILSEIEHNPILEEFAAHYERESTLFYQSSEETER